LENAKIKNLNKDLVGNQMFKQRYAKTGVLSYLMAKSYTQS